MCSTQRLMTLPVKVLQFDTSDFRVSNNPMNILSKLLIKLAGKGIHWHNAFAIEINVSRSAIKFK